MPLADIDSVTYLVTSVELWEHSIDIFIAGIPSRETTRRQQAAQQALTARGQAQRAGTGHGGLPPDPIGTAQLGQLIEISDDLGTPYRLHHASAGGTGSEWRLHKTCTPGVPTTATMLIVHVNDDDGRPRHSRSIPLQD